MPTLPDYARAIAGLSVLTRNLIIYYDKHVYITMKNVAFRKPVLYYEAVITHA